MSTTIEKKQKVLTCLKKYLMIADPSGTNYQRYERLLMGMNDLDFKKWADALKNGTMKLFLLAPNMKLSLQLPDLFAAADALGLEVFHHLRLYDQSTGRYYITPEKYPVLKLHVRRQQQFLKEKTSTADSDRTIDNLTGQVTGADRSSSVSNPEVQILYTRGLHYTLLEFLKVRGGDIASYGEFKRQMEEGGSAEINQLTANSRARSAVIAGVLMKSMHLDNNF